MAKIKAKTRKTVKAKAIGAKKASVVQPKDAFRQPLEMLQNGFNSVMSYFK
ncbi:MAG: hypothetical protein WC634_05890 [archaeon]